jgi:outer membrane protein assembly factor BamB
VPPRDVLERLNLTVGWNARLPIAGRRDGLFTLQLLPAKNRTQLVVQTVYGAIFMLDAETGDLLWRATVGLPDWQGQAVGYNEQSIFATRRDIVYVLNRATGKHRFFTLDKDTKLPNYGFKLPGAPSAAASADEDMISVALGDRVEGYLLPDWDSAEKTEKLFYGKEPTPQERQAFQERTDALPPLLRWSVRQAGTNVMQPVLVASTRVAAVTSSGNVLFLKKYDQAPPDAYQMSGNVVAPMGQHGSMAYVGSEDYSLYALNVDKRHLAWRFLASAPIVVKPVVTDRDVFVTGYRHGLYRVERDTGREIWLNQRADRFLSTNQQFVFALDRTGVLLVLDYARGGTLAQFDMRDWTIPVPNELNDRFYLASQDGQILCLRHRAETTPVRTKTIETPAVLVPKKEEMKGDKVDQPDVDKAKAKDKDADKEDGKDKDQDKKKDNDKKKDADEANGAARIANEEPQTMLCRSWPRWNALPANAFEWDADRQRSWRLGP